MENYENLKYKFNIIPYNLTIELGRYEELGNLFRELAGHELRHRFSFDDQMYAFMIMATGKPATLAALRALTDEEIRIIARAPFEFSGEKSVEFLLKENRSRVQLKSCDHCSDVETAMAVFKRCVVCHARYCTKKMPQGPLADAQAHVQASRDKVAFIKPVFIASACNRDMN